MKQQDYKTLFGLVSNAVITKRTGDLRKALADGMDPDSPNLDDNRRTLLFNYNLPPAVAKVLLTAGANIAYPDANRLQPLHSTNPKVAALLLAAGADLEAREPKDGLTPLIAHAYRGDAKMVKFLLDQGAYVLARTTYGNDVIGAAAFSATTSNYMGGSKLIYRLVERHIADGLISRRFKLRGLQDIRA